MTRSVRTLIVALTVLALTGAGARAIEPLPEPRAAGKADSADTLYFPPASGAWETVAPAAAGWDAKALEAALAYAGEQRSSGVVVLHRGRILAERYWELAPMNPDDPLDPVRLMTTDKTSDGRTIEDVASVQKSAVSFLAGVARGKGLLDFDAPVGRYLGKGWSKASPVAEGAITVRHVLSMASGLALDGSYEAPAGGKWFYNTAVYRLMVQVIEKASGLGVDAYTREWLTARVGMADTHWTPRSFLAEAGEEAAKANTIGLSTSARDLARFGLLVLAGGRWKGEDVLGDPRYLAEALAPSQPHNPSYGLLWWLNGQPQVRSAGADAAMTEGPMIPTAPADLVAAQGSLVRRLYVVPSLELVVTRLGDRAAKGFDDELWRRLMAAAPKPAEP